MAASPAAEVFMEVVFPEVEASEEAEAFTAEEVTGKSNEALQGSIA